MKFSHSSFSGLIGVGRADITPPVGIYARNWGAAQHDVAEGIHRPLTATVLTLQSALDESPLVLVALDLGWWRTSEDEWFMRGGLIESLSLDPARVLINLSHTHAGPAICREDADKPGGALIAPYLEQLRKAVITIVRQVLTSSQPAVLEWSQGKCNLAQNRDLPDPQNERIVCGYNPAGAADDTLLVGRVTSEDNNGNEVLATLINYACHPTTLAWENQLISPDYIGAMREVVEAHTNAPCLFLQGASGDLAPREQYSGDTDLADAHGRQLGYAGLSTLENMLPPRTQLEYAGVVESGAPLAIWQKAPAQPSCALAAVSTEVEVPLQPMPSLAELEAQLQNRNDRVLGERSQRKLRVRRSVGDGSTTRLPLWAWRIGDAVLLGQQNEAYSVLQTHLRQKFSGRAVVVMNLVNGGCGYLPPQEYYDADIYAVWQTPFGRGSLERMSEAAEQAIRQIL